jgi:LPXTG-motif cell wall-anchored protein
MEMKKLAFGGLAVAAGLTLTLSATPAMAVTSTTSFKVTSMTTTNPLTVDADATSGDDGGFLAITTDVLLRDGDDEVYSYNKSTLVAVGGSLTALNDNDLFSDLATATAYEFITDGDGYTGAFVLDAAGNRTATELTFSELIPVGNDDDWVGASGAGQVAFWNGTTGDIWVVSLPAGTITKVTGQSLFSAFAVEPADNGEGTDLMQAGILEYNCTAYSFLLMDSSPDANLVRYNAADATDELILEGDASSDIDTIMVSPTDSRWYVHSEDEGGSVFGIDVSALDEPIVSGDAVTTSGACADTPTLPDTGVSENAGIWAASAALIAGLGVAGVFMARRRQA